MKKLIAAAAAVGALAALGGCGEDAGPGGVTAEESAELNNAADMLDVPSDSLAAGEDTMLGNGEAPAQTGEVLVGSEANGAAPANGTAPDAGANSQ
jgi:hypothetical protein